ncbi:MAG: histidine kinase, partial [Pseudomonadota bacterium]
MRFLLSRWRFNYGQKLLWTATLPLVIAAMLISVFVTLQSRQLAEGEIEALEAELIAAKRDELKNYLSIARTAFISIYGRAAPDDA